jgi:hypothetical protein
MLARVSSSLAPPRPVPHRPPTLRRVAEHRHMARQAAPPTVNRAGGQCVPNGPGRLGDASRAGTIPAAHPGEPAAPSARPIAGGGSCTKTMGSTSAGTGGRGTAASRWRGWPCSSCWPRPPRPWLSPPTGAAPGNRRSHRGQYHTGRHPGDAVIRQQQEDQLTRLLRARLAADEWEPGQRLPTVAALTADYQAGHGTIRRALGRLQDEGLIVTLPRYGTFWSRRDRAKG